MINKRQAIQCMLFVTITFLSCVMCCYTEMICIDSNMLIFCDCIQSHEIRQSNCSLLCTQHTHTNICVATYPSKGNIQFGGLLGGLLFETLGLKSPYHTHLNITQREIGELGLHFVAFRRPYKGLRKKTTSRPPIYTVQKE